MEMFLNVYFGYNTRATARTPVVDCFRLTLRNALSNMKWAPNSNVKRNN